MVTETTLLAWSLTPWQMKGDGTWKVQPIIVVEDHMPFFADHPDAYIERLEEMHDDPTLERGRFFTQIGELKDGLELAWNTEGDSA